MRRIKALFVLVIIIWPVFADIPELETFSDGFYIGGLYISAHHNQSDILKYNNEAKIHNDKINRTYGTEAKRYLLPLLPPIEIPENKKVLNSGLSEDTQRAAINLFGTNIYKTKDIQANAFIRQFKNGIQIGQLAAEKNVAGFA